MGRTTLRLFCCDSLPGPVCFQNQDGSLPLDIQEVGSDLLFSRAKVQLKKSLSDRYCGLYCNEAFINIFFHFKINSPNPFPHSVREAKCWLLIPSLKTQKALVADWQGEKSTLIGFHHSGQTS